MAPPEITTDGPTLSHRGGIPLNGAPTSPRRPPWSPWQLTEEERWQRQALAERRTARARPAPGRIRAHTPPPCRRFGEPVRAALFAPSAASRQLQQEIVERATTCHDAHDLEYVITNDAVQSTTSESPEWTRRGHREVTRLAEAFNTHGRFANVRSHLEAARERCNPRLTEICAAIERATA